MPGKRARPTTSEQTHQPEVHMLEGEVFVSLPDDGYMRMTPDQARRMACRLFVQAARADGKPVPEVIVLTDVPK